MSMVASHEASSHFLEIVLPEAANHYGTLYGAHALLMMGKAAFAGATRYCRCPVVMAAADAITFVEPIRVGAIISISAKVVHHGRSSMVVEVEISPDGQRDTPSIGGRFTMVAVDESGQPAPFVSTPHQPLLEDSVS
ncbi:acyl-CoA thioesterase [Ensifer adhaerens]|uniref:acyl-CoA thioesterase n=1 Tax=Ensifer adhaerens TaxID=106592 RepID=UPI003D067FE8